MQKKTHPLSSSRLSERTPPLNSVSSECLPDFIESWLLSGDIQQHSGRTIESRRERLRGLVWFLSSRSLPWCGVNELRAFLHYLTHGHKEPGGRFGNPRLNRGVTPGTVKSYYSSIRTLFNWLVEEGVLESSPVERIKPPIDRPDQIVTFTLEECSRMCKAARKGQHPNRDEGIILMMLDTGARVTEICDLKVTDVQLPAGKPGSITVDGKGGKRRTIPFSPATKRLIYEYLSERSGDEDLPEGQALWLSDRGRDTGGGLTRVGMLKLVKRVAAAAGIEGKRCSPHTFRHTFAIEFLRSGGDVFTLKEILGHESLAMTNRYVAIAQADISAQHKKHSPVSKIKKR